METTSTRLCSRHRPSRGSDSYAIVDGRSSHFRETGLVFLRLLTFAHKPHTIQRIFAFPSLLYPPHVFDHCTLHHALCLDLLPSYPLTPFVTVLPPPQRDVQWLVEVMASASSSSPGEAGRRWLTWLNEGLSLPYPLGGILAAIWVALRPMFAGGGSGGGRGGRQEGAEVMSPARLQSAIWASEGEGKGGGAGGGVYRC